jgi:hypothetical protein
VENKSQIELTQGQIALVDPGDQERLARYKWFAHYAPKRGIFYAARNAKIGNKKTIVWMHREVLGVSDRHIDVDHRNRETLDNRRCNLRTASRSQNKANAGLTISNKSGFKGVSWHSQTGKWIAMIHPGGKSKYLGLFADKAEAARAYDAAAIREFGDFAKLNLSGRGQ